MHKQSILMMILSVAAAAMMTGCAGTPSEKDFIDPTVTLNRVEVPYHVGYYYFSNKVKPTKGDAGNYGAPMMMAFIFDITNNAGYPVELDGFKFSVMFEEFEANTVNSPETMWIPPRKDQPAARAGHVRYSPDAADLTAARCCEAKGKRPISLGRTGKVVGRCTGFYLHDRRRSRSSRFQGRRPDPCGTV